jgi:hypothetical protein
MRSAHRWIFVRGLICTLSVASVGCNQTIEVLRGDHENDAPMTRDDAYRRQLDLDVAAIIRGMALAHGGQVVASTPRP